MLRTSFALIVAIATITSVAYAVDPATKTIPTPTLSVIKNNVLITKHNKCLSVFQLKGKRWILITQNTMEPGSLSMDEIFTEFQSDETRHADIAPFGKPICK